MKKIFIILIVLIVSFLLSSYSYAKKCKKCLEDRATRKDRMVDIGIAHRDFETSIVYKDGKAYATYRCCFGHVYLVCLED